VVDVQRKAERDEQSREDRNDCPRRDPLPRLFDIRREVVHQRQRHHEEPRTDRPAQDIPEEFKDAAEAHEGGQSAPELGTKDQEHDSEQQKERQAHGQQQRDPADFPPGAPFLHIIGLVQRRRDGHHGTGGGPQCGQNPEGQQPAFLLRHELPDIVLEEL